MITFPEQYVKTRFPGYVWNLEEQWLYSFKYGVLKKLVKSKGWQLPYRTVPPGWAVSVNGSRRYLPAWTLERLSKPELNETVDTAKS